MITIKKNKRNKNNIKIIIIATIASSLFSCISSYATSRYLYDSKEVRYDNTSTSTLTSATDVQTALDDLYSCASTYELTIGSSTFHNAIFRGKDVTEYLTSEYSLYDRISDGTFTDLYVGDYVIVNDITWRIAGFDIYYGRGGGDTSTNQAGYNHHAVIVPDTILTTGKMNTSNTTSGGYAGSYMVKTLLPSVLSTYITPVFGSHVLTYYDTLTYAVSNGVSTLYTNLSRSLDLMNEVQLYGTVVHSSSGNEVGTDTVQFPLFKLRPEFIVYNRSSSYWLRTIGNASGFIVVWKSSNSDVENATSSKGIRPYFYIG